MLGSDFSREANTYLQNYYFLYTMCFSGTLTSNQRRYHVKLKSILNQIFILVFLKTFSTISMQQT